MPSFQLELTSADVVVNLVDFHVHRQCFKVDSRMFHSSAALFMLLKFPSR